MTLLRHVVPDPLGQFIPSKENDPVYRTSSVIAHEPHFRAVREAQLKNESGTFKKSKPLSHDHLRDDFRFMVDDEMRIALHHR